MTRSANPLRPIRYTGGLSPKSGNTRIPLEDPSALVPRGLAASFVHRALLCKEDPVARIADPLYRARAGAQRSGWGTMWAELRHVHLRPGVHLSRLQMTDWGAFESGRARRTDLHNGKPAHWIITEARKQFKTLCYSKRVISQASLTRSTKGLECAGSGPTGRGEDSPPVRALTPTTPHIERPRSRRSQLEMHSWSLSRT